MNQTTRAWIGFLVAPGVPGVFQYLVGLVRGYGDAAIVGPLLLSPFAYVGALVLGGPVYLILRRKGVHDVGTYVALGAAIGAVFVVLLFGTEALFSWTSAREHAIALIKSSVGYLMMATVYAAIASAVFWFIAVRPRRSSLV